MIVRRMTAAAAGVALAAAVAGPAMAASNTVITLDQDTLNKVGAAQISVSAIKPAKKSGNKITIPAKMKGKKVIDHHKGGFKLASPTASLSITDIEINAKSGKANASVTPAPLQLGTLPIKNLLLFKGGKNTIKKNGKWTGAKVYLAKSVDIPNIGTQTTQQVLSLVFGLPVDIINQVLPGEISLGTANIKVKK